MGRAHLDDPRWQEARARYVADRRGQDEDEAFAEQVRAAHDMWRIETGREPVAGPPPERLAAALGEYGQLRGT